MFKFLSLNVWIPKLKVLNLNFTVLKCKFTSPNILKALNERFCATQWRFFVPIWVCEALADAVYKEDLHLQTAIGWDVPNLSAETRKLPRYAAFRAKWGVYRHKLMAQNGLYGWYYDIYIAIIWYEWKFICVCKRKYSQSYGRLLQL